MLVCKVNEKKYAASTPTHILIVNNVLSHDPRTPKMKVLEAINGMLL